MKTFISAMYRSVALAAFSAALAIPAQAGSLSLGGVSVEADAELSTGGLSVDADASIGGGTNADSSLSIDANTTKSGDTGIGADVSLGLIFADNPQLAVRVKLALAKARQGQPLTEAEIAVLAKLALAGAATTAKITLGDEKSVKARLEVALDKQRKGKPLAKADIEVLAAVGIDVRADANAVASIGGTSDSDRRNGSDDSARITGTHARAFAVLSTGERDRLQRRCMDVLASPDRFSEMQVTVCELARSR